MPRKRRPSYGVTRKHKRPRCVSDPSSEPLNEGFLCNIDDSISDTDEEDISLNTGFLKDKTTQASETIDLQAESTVPTRVETLQNDLSDLPRPFLLNKHSNILGLLCVNSDQNNGTSYINIKLCITEWGLTTVYVHGKRLAQDHFLWERVPNIMTTRADVLCLLDVLSSLTVCPGNYEEEFVPLIRVGSTISHPDSGTIAYHEGNFHSQHTSTIRSVSCTLLINDDKDKPRCKQCAKYRKCLQQKRKRHEKLLNSDMDFSKSSYKHSDMPREILVRKLDQQREQIRCLQNNVDRLERHLKKQISKDGILLDKCYSGEMIDLMHLCEKDVVKSYPDSNSFHRLFWSQQLKAVTGDKHGMRWHPMIIRWCLAIRQKSQAAYDTVRDAGFIKLPSNRILFDYSHYIKSELGFNQDVLQMLHAEAEKCDSFKEDWLRYCGILSTSLLLDKQHMSHAYNICLYVDFRLRLAIVTF